MLFPTERTGTYNTDDVDEVYELVKDSLRDSSFRSVNVRKRTLFGGETDEPKYEIEIRFVVCKPT